MIPLGVLTRPYPLTSDEKKFFLAMAMVMVALPLIWVVLAMTGKRLRDAGVASWFVFLFFVPAVNVVVFLHRPT